MMMMIIIIITRSSSSTKECLEAQAINRRRKTMADLDSCWQDVGALRNPDCAAVRGSLRLI